MASFIYEIAWIRMLSLVLGSATHSFELMLSAFILGLALGAFWIRSRADRLRDPERRWASSSGSWARLALATLPLYAASFGWVASLLATFARSDQGYVGFTVGPLRALPGDHAACHVLRRHDAAAAHPDLLGRGHRRAGDRRGIRLEHTRLDRRA